MNTIAKQNELLRHSSAIEERLSVLVLGGGTFGGIAHTTSEATGRLCAILDAGFNRPALGCGRVSVARPASSVPHCPPTVTSAPRLERNAVREQEVPGPLVDHDPGDPPEGRPAQATRERSGRARPRPGGHDHRRGAAKVRAGAPGSRRSSAGMRPVTAAVVTRWQPPRSSLSRGDTHSPAQARQTHSGRLPPSATLDMGRIRSAGPVLSPAARTGVFSPPPRSSEADPALSRTSIRLRRPS